VKISFTVGDHVRISKFKHVFSAHLKHNMSLVDSISVPSTISELDLFTVPPTQVVIKKGYWAELHPVNPVTNEDPYEFRIPPDPHMLQMSKNYMYMKLKISKNKQAGLRCQPFNCFAPINLIGKSFFQTGEIVHWRKVVL